MSGLNGKGSVSLKKGLSYLSSIPQIGFKSIEFMHEAAEGDLSIDLQNLTAPQVALDNGFLQPSPSDLAKTNLKMYKENLILKSSSGLLLPFIDYVVSGSQTIKLLRPALDQEIFSGSIQQIARSGQTLVDAAPLIASGTLAAGQTDFNVGAYPVGKFPGKDHGAVMVFEDGQLVYRNDGNQAAGMAIEGDYQEVDSIIRFNTPSGSDRQISVLSVGSLVEQPQESFNAIMEVLQGQIDAMVPTLAALAGVDETDFQLAPNNVDLKAFGDRVLSLERILDLEIPINTAWATFSPNLSQNGWGTITISHALWRRRGGSMELNVKFTAGTVVGASEARFDLPNGELVSSALSAASIVGIVGKNNTTVNDYSVLAQPGLSYLNFGASRDAAAAGNIVPATITSLSVSNGVIIGFSASVQIQGWADSQTISQALGL